MSANRLIKSFRHALRGMHTAFTEEQNFKVMIFMAVLSGVIILFKPLPLSLRATLVIASGFLLAIELMNTAMEKAMNLFSPTSHDEIRKIKDMMAAAALVAAIVWAIIFAWVLVA